MDPRDGPTGENAARMTIDVWMQHPTQRFLNQEAFESLRRWTGQQIPEDEIPIEATIAAMDAAEVSFGILSAWHGPQGPVLLYALVTILFRQASPASRLLIATALECGWEILENTSFIIDRYRAETVSLNYYGDSVLNSLGDIVAAIAGCCRGFTTSKTHHNHRRHCDRDSPGHLDTR